MRLIKKLLYFIILTLITQLGGIIYIISHFIYYLLGLLPLKGYRETLRRISFHVFVYLLFTFFIIPPIAGFYGRVPLPIFSENNLGPRSILTVILNRHYVRFELKETTLRISTEMALLHPGIRINYFDANHPFYKGYPLIPHLSHNDGKKLDLGFVYYEIDNNQISPNTPSVIGYGISEEPNHGEFDRPSDCSQNPKNWMYNFMRNLYPQGAKRDYQFNAITTRELINLFARNRNIQKIFLEPHLKARLNLTSGKIQPVQCGSVRHDDHFHVQVY